VEDAELGFELDHGGRRWQVTRAGLASEMDFEHGIASAAALDYAPVCEPVLQDWPLLEPAPAS
jgi:hypothetical protein